MDAHLNNVAKTQGIPVEALAPPVTVAGREPLMRPVPALGEHNNEILGGLGLSGAAIDDLRSRKVI